MVLRISVGRSCKDIDGYEWIVKEVKVFAIEVSVSSFLIMAVGGSAIAVCMKERV